MKFTIGNKKILYAFILMPLIIDIIIGVFYMFEINTYVGKIYRGILYLIGILFFLKNVKKEFLFIIIPFIWSLLFVFWFLLSDNFSITREFTFYFKITYFFMIFIVIKNVKFSNNLEKIKYLIYIIKYYSQIIATLIIFSFITKIGIQTYGKWVFGTSSFFVAQNDIGLSLLLMFTFLLFNKKEANISWVWIFLIFFSLIFLGTSTGMFGSIIVVLLFVFIKLILPKVKSINNFVLRFISISSIIAISIVTLFVLISYIQNSPYYSLKYNKIITEGVRSTHSVSVNDYFDKRTIIENLFGEGFSSFSVNYGNTVPNIKYSKSDFKNWVLVERDFHDIYGAFGLFYTILFFSYFIYIFLLSIINYINKKNIFTLSLLMIYVMAIIHSYFAGHVFYSPTVMGVFSIIVYFIYSNYFNYEK